MPKVVHKGQQVNNRVMSTEFLNAHEKQRLLYLGHMYYSQNSIDLASKFPRSQSYRASVECAGKQVWSIEGSAAKVLVPEITGYLQISCKIYVLMGKSCLAKIKGIFILGNFDVLTEWYLSQRQKKSSNDIKSIQDDVKISILRLTLETLTK